MSRKLRLNRYRTKEGPSLYEKQLRRIREDLKGIRAIREANRKESSRLFEKQRQTLKGI
ncbi:MAG: hypothetical protein LGR52_08975 [Candidatus Thiosymbion ectosymbiont of Robbea hypermnestra]|nr:hypothetical protein [Candidatus Thiosymbion ectosymbiont of Robbea hypermnestra]